MRSHSTTMRFSFRIALKQGRQWSGRLLLVRPVPVPLCQEIVTPHRWHFGRLSWAMCSFIQQARHCVAVFAETSTPHVEHVGFGWLAR